MSRIIDIKDIKNEIDEVYTTTSNPGTKRRYAVDLKYVSELIKFEGEKKAVISSEEISRIKPEFNGKLKKYQISIEEIIKNMGYLNGLASLDSNLRKYSINPKDFEEVITEQFDKYVKISNEKDQRINELEQQIKKLERENISYKIASQTLEANPYEERKEKVA